MIGTIAIASASTLAVGVGIMKHTQRRVVNALGGKEILSRMTSVVKKINAAKSQEEIIANTNEMLEIFAFDETKNGMNRMGDLFSLFEKRNSMKWEMIAGILLTVIGAASLLTTGIIALIQMI